MAAIDDLINQIADTDLRDRIKAEVDKINSQKKFGLVFEDHLPESTPLYDVPIRIGSVVGPKTGYMKENYVVTAMDGDDVTCINRTTKEEAVFNIDELVCVAQFGEPIYPYLKPIDSVCNAPDSDLWHTLIEADNYHALQLLEYLYAGKVDCIYIDPPYNTGARDWKYNNDYVDSTDQYRHSKWLSMMKKRLLLAKKLLKSNDSMLMLTIDDIELSHIKILLDELFPECQIQIVDMFINPKGKARIGRLSQVDEYLLLVYMGNAKTVPENSNIECEEIRWPYLRRSDVESARGTTKGGTQQFYPIYVNPDTEKIERIGEPLLPEQPLSDAMDLPGLIPVFPIREDGKQMNWGLTGASLEYALENGCVRVMKSRNPNQAYNFTYVTMPSIRKALNGEYIISGIRDDGTKTIILPAGKESQKPTAWKKTLYDANVYGTQLVGSILGEKRFSFPKSLYSVYDALQIYIKTKPNALIVDFFAGSGTTLHAVNLLNAEDGGNRRCILVTNNEVSEEEAKTLSEHGYNPGDEEWEKLGIARYVTWPRTVCSIEGHDINGNKLEDDYISSNTIDKETKRTFKQLKFIEDAASLSISDKKQLVTILSNKVLPQTIVQNDCRYIVSEEQNHTCSILFDESSADEWLEALKGMDHIVEFYIFTKKNKIFKSLKDSISDMLGNIITKEPIKIPMADGFKTNAAYFKLGFLDKNFVALGKQFKELLSVFWMKAGAIGKCPTIESEELPDMLVLPENKFAVLIDETAYKRFVAEIEKHPEIKTIYIVTDSENAYKEMIRCFEDKDTYQLYRDYLDNFRINVVR